MVITVNQKKRTIDTEQSIQKFLDTHGLDSKQVAVEYNKRALQKQQYETTILREGDQLEIVRFVGGG